MDTALSEPIRKTRLYEKIAARIQQQIASGQLSPGDHLPSERELSERFGVSRTSIRDAIRVLELLGMVEARQGEGTVVREGSVANLVAPLATAVSMQKDLVIDLMEVRIFLEPQVAALAATRATPEEVARLRAIIARQEERVSRGESGVDEDATFHDVIARASRNEVVLRVVGVMMDLLREIRERWLVVRGRAESSLAGHRRVLDAIEQRDPAAAEAAMRAHLVEIQEILTARPQQ